MNSFKIRYKPNQRALADAFLAKVKAFPGVTWATRYFGPGACNIVKVEGEFTDDQKLEMLAGHVEYKR